MTPCISSPATSSRTLPGAHSHSPSTYPVPTFRQMPPSFAPAPASPLEDNRIPALPSDSPHTATQIVVLPHTGSCYAPAECSAPPCAPPTTDPLRPLPSPARAAPPAPP